VYVTQAPALHDELVPVVARLRWRLGLERLLLFVIRGTLASGLALIILSAFTWLTGVTGDVLWLSLTPLVVMLGAAVVLWPTALQAALAADSRLGLEERLATAVELKRRQHVGRFDALQIRDAAQRAERAPTVWLAVDARARNEGLLAVGVLVLAAASLLLAVVPRPFAPTANRAIPTVDNVVAPELAEQALPLNTSEPLFVNPQPVQSIQADPNLAARVQQEQAEQGSLDNLARALGSISAGQAAADDIQRGDFGAASAQLKNLGDQADQLSDVAKQQLANALRQAAAATSSTDRQLADKEQQAAQALSRSNYVSQQQALRSLADQLQRSGARSVPADQLERDVGQLQQQSAAGPGGQAGTARQPGSPDAAPAGQTAQAGAGGGQTRGPDGQPGAPGVGTGSDPDMLGAAPQPLATSGQRVDVPTRLNGGPGVRPANGTEDQAGGDGSTLDQTVSELAQAQQTGQVAPEQNLVPGHQRPVVRGYFR
jgi:hypothetical protein